MPPSLSLTIIMRDEEIHVPQLLSTAHLYADEIVIVDTGSVDRTKEEAKKFTPLVYDFNWCDDFSAARNFGIEHWGVIPDIITAANGAGSDSTSGPTFEIAEESPYRTEAIGKAVADARSAAEAMAEAAKKRVGDVLNISTSNVTVPVYGRSMAFADAMKAAVPIETGQLEITANVTVVFELK